MKEIVISKINEGQRADKFIRKYLSNAPLSFIYKLFRVKDVKVNGKRIQKDYVLKENDFMQIYVTDNQLDEFSKPRVVVKSNFNLDVVYEDDNILIVNKPSGILVHGDSNEKRITLTNIVLNYLVEKGEFDLSNTYAFVPSPCHRLDRNTSGLVIFGKNIESLHQLEDLFKSKTQIEKEYITLVCGKLYGKNKIDAPLYKDEEKNMVFVRNVNNGGKNALTYYESIETFDNSSLLKVRIVTGRTHQIRVHLSYIGHPIIGDNKYGNFMMNKRFEEAFHYKNQFLHSYRLSFLDIDGKLKYLNNKTFVANVPEKESSIIEMLKECRKI